MNLLEEISVLLYKVTGFMNLSDFCYIGPPWFFVGVFESLSPFPCPLFGVCMHMSPYDCIHFHMYATTYYDLYREIRKQPWVLVWPSRSYGKWTDLWASKEMLALTSLYSQECWDDSCMCFCAHFYVGSGHLMSDSYICVTVLLSNKPSPQPQCYICLIKTFCRFSSIYFYVCLILL